MRKFFYLVGCATFLISCDSKIKNETQSSKFEVINTENLNIGINSSDTYLSFSNQVYNGLLYRLSTFDDVIDVYSLSDKTKKNQFKFKSEGPNHISAFQGAAISKIGVDSFLIANNYSQIYITHKDSILFKKNLIEEGLLSSKEYRSFGINKLKPITISNDVFLAKFSQYNPGTVNFYKDNTLMKFNFREKKLSECEIKFSNHYKDFFWSGYHYMPSFTSKDHLIYISFPINPKVYFYDSKQDKIIDSVETVSKYDNKAVEPLKSPLKGRSRTERYAKQNIRYETINFEPHQKLFYRIIVLPVETEEDLLSELTSNVVNPFSVMVLDEYYKILVEEKFLGKTYDIKDYFVTDKGLWISNNNPENPNFSEDHLSFTLFELAEKKE